MGTAACEGTQGVWNCGTSPSLFPLWPRDPQHGGQQRCLTHAAACSSAALAVGHGMRTGWDGAARNFVALL